MASSTVGEERFLSERRASLPDIDIDVESARRLEVYDRIIQRFGIERVAVTGMSEAYRARHALRDTGPRARSAPHVVDRVARSFSHIRAADIRGTLAELPELCGLMAQAGSYGMLWKPAEALDELPRGIAMHPCGVILSNATLLDRLPCSVRDEMRTGSCWNGDSTRTRRVGSEHAIRGDLGIVVGHGRWGCQYAFTVRTRSRRRAGCAQVGAVNGRQGGRG